MLPAPAIAQYWSRRAPFDYVRADEPLCFGCRCPGLDWSALYFQRAHLVDRCYGGLDHAGNLALLCGGCHAVMPSFENGQGPDAITWVRQGGWLGALPPSKREQAKAAYHQHCRAEIARDVAAARNAA